MIRAKFIVIIGVLTLIAISFGVFSTPNGFNPWEQLDCGIKGGSYFMAAEYFVCQIPVSDQGKSCTDSDQCIDICRADTEEDTQGICTAFGHGCDIVLVQGKAHWLCS